MRKNLSLVLLLACSIFYVLANLEISTPLGLKQWWQNNPDGTGVSIATFGEIPWGEKISGRLSLANPQDACSYLQLDSNSTHTEPIVVAIRGTCPFALKAYYAQLAGAKLLLIVDNTYEDVSTRLITGSGNDENIHIPSALLAKQGGDKIIESLASPDEEINTIIGTFEFGIQKAESMNYNLWLTSASPETFKFLKEWKQYYDILAPVARMEPHYRNFKGEELAYEANDDENCVCGIRYCSIGLAQGSPYTGREVLNEDLRQMCLIRNYGIEVWWNYVLEYAESCLSNDQDMDDCSRSTLMKIEIDRDDIDLCVARSFDTGDLTGCTKNRLFDTEEEAANIDMPIMLPSVVINHKFTYRGNLVPAKELFETICKSFATMPDVCLPPETKPTETAQPIDSPIESETSSTSSTPIPDQASSHQESSLNQDGSADETVTETETTEPQKSDESSVSIVVIGGVCSIAIGLVVFLLYRRKKAAALREGLLSDSL